MYISPLLEVTADLLRRGGIDPTDQVRALLASQSDSPGTPLVVDPGTLFNTSMTGFFQAAATGDTFTDRERIAQRFGRTLEENYPEAGEAFLRFAYSYWTLKLVVGDADEATRSSIAYQLLAEIEQMVAGLFFPTPGPVRIDHGQREAAQRQTLQESGAAIDIEDFIRHNPILLRDRRSTSTGCLGVLALAVLPTATITKLLP